MIRKTLTVISFIGLLLSTGLWAASYYALGFSADVVTAERHHEFGLGEGTFLYNSWAFPLLFEAAHHPLKIGDQRFEIHRSVWQPDGDRGWLPSLHCFNRNLRISVHLWLPTLIFFCTSAYLGYMPIRVRKKQKDMRIRRIVTSALLCCLVFSGGVGIVSYVLRPSIGRNGPDGFKIRVSVLGGKLNFRTSHDAANRSPGWSVNTRPSDRHSFAYKMTLWLPRIEWGTTPRGWYFGVRTHFYIPTALFGSLFWYAYAPIYRLRKREKLGLCLQCGYDLRASKDRCPECGAAFEKL